MVDLKVIYFTCTLSIIYLLWRQQNTSLSLMTHPSFSSGLVSCHFFLLFVDCIDFLWLWLLVRACSLPLVVSGYQTHWIHAIQALCLDSSNFYTVLSQRTLDRSFKLDDFVSGDWVSHPLILRLAVQSAAPLVMCASGLGQNTSLFSMVRSATCISV